MTFVPRATGFLREAHDDRPRKEFKLKRDMTNDEIRQALGVGAHSAPLLMSENAFYTEVDAPTPEGCQFFGWRSGPDTFNVVATESHAWLVAKAEEIGDFVRDC